MHLQPPKIGRKRAVSVPDWSDKPPLSHAKMAGSSLFSGEGVSKILRRPNFGSGHRGPGKKRRLRRSFPPPCGQAVFCYEIYFASVNPQFSRLHNLILVIKQFDSSVVKRTPAIIKTHFLAGKVFVIAEQINAMKEYSKNFAAYAKMIEASVEKFEQAVEFFKKNKIVL